MGEKKGTDKKRNRSTLVGAAFIMATSAIGPGFLTQTSKFIGDFQGSFGFVILASVILSIIVQLNVWRVLCVSGMRGQDVSNKVVPGLGYAIAGLIVVGGLIFNIGNVGGAALGFNTLFDLDLGWGYLLAGIIGVIVFLSKNISKTLDTFTKILGGLMIVVIFVVILIVKPPVGTALKETFMPSTGVLPLVPAVLTILGGTVGGYITFSGAHRLIDAGITGKDKLDQIQQSSVMGLGIASLVRVLMFLAVFGVVARGGILDQANPAADAFRQGAGQMGYRFFGLVLTAASVTSIVGAAYTSVSFMKTLSTTVQKHEKIITILFIIISTAVMAVLGSPAKLLVLVGALNGLILPITLGVCLVASQKKEIMGADYQHPKWLFYCGIVVVLIAAYIGITSLSSLGALFA